MMLLISNYVSFILLMSSFNCRLNGVEGLAEKYGYGFTYVKGSKSWRNGEEGIANRSSLNSLQSVAESSHQSQMLQADGPYSDPTLLPAFPFEENSHLQWPLSYGRNHADQSTRNRFKNPRNVPSESCPRNENDAQAQGRTCLRKCTADEDCRSPRKKCLCDGVCGMSCIKPDKECHELGNPNKGRVFLTGRFFGDRAIYSCEEGFILVGVESRLCQADGSWSATEPSCQKIVHGGTYCGDPPVVQHARHNAPLEQSSFALDTMLQYQCYPGYNTVGFARAKCLLYNNTAMWFGPDVTCEPRSCGEPGDMQHGRYEGDCFSFSCRVTYSCQPGFDLVGRANRYCQADGSWTPAELPTCVPVQCPIPANPDHGKSIYTSISYNAVVTYECRYGYTLVGKATRRCGPDKKWSGEEPYCKEINCGHPGPLYNGWIENLEQGGALGVSVIYRCFEGMKRTGASSATCERDGQWSYPPPQCLAPCVVPTVENGRVASVIPGIVVSHGENLTLQCNRHFEPEYGSSATTCNNGTWNFIPRCVPARCKVLPPRPRHGMVIAPRIEHGSRALYKCKDGFQLVGPNVTECLFGNWTGDLPTCQEIYCPFPGYIENGKVLLVGNMGLYDYRPYVRKVTNNKQIMYECDRGYVLGDGPPGATCVAGKWSPKHLPTCVPGQHPRMRWARSVKSGRAPVSTAIKNSRKSQGRGKGRKGKVKGTFDETPSSHGSSKSCEPLADEPYAQVEIVKPGKNSSDTFSTGTVVRVTCSQGYRLNVGNRTVRCRKGLWSPDKPSCLALTCSVPAIDNAIFRYQNVPVSPQTEIPHNEAAQFGCNPGYVVQGPEILRCWYGEWAITQKSECAPAPCELPRIQHGDYTAGYRAGLTIANGSTVDYTCTEPEYFKISQGPVRCRLGELTPDYPECKSRNDRFYGFDGGDMGRNTLLEFKGGGDITEGGKMEFFLNERKTCVSPTKVQGTLLFKDGEPVKSGEQRFPHGTQVTFHCVSGILRDKTTWQIICEDGAWIGRPLSCDGEVSVEGLGQPSNRSCVFRNSELNVVTFYEDQQITEDIVEFPPGTELVSRCSDIGKYALLGSVRRRCSRGEWTGVTPVCFGLNQENDYALEKPPTVLLRHQLGPIAQSNDGKLIVYPGTILHMECLWIRKFGTPKWEVSHNYRKYPQGWTEEAGRDRTLEYRLSIYHAQKDDSGIFSCSTPTRHVHSIEVLVRAVHCSQIPERKGLTVSSKNTKMNSKVHFSCQNGNSLVGAPEVTCLPSGNWNAPIPVCESVECLDIVNSTDKMLRVSVVSREVGGKALFTCTGGTILRGATEVMCLPSGDWSQPLPRCEEVLCDGPETPENGYIQGGTIYKAGDVVQFHCHRDFMMEGQPIAACQDNGKWSSGAPKCVPACTYPGTTIGGTISSVKFYYSIGETISFDCSPGLTLNGSRMLRCLKNGKWSAAIPTCVPAQV